MAKRRVGVIGRTGKGNYGHGIDSVWKEIPEIEVAAVADEDQAGREKAMKITGAKTAYADYREMLAKEKLDLVGIGPRWIDQHRDMILAAAEHGCHIYMEKPFCRTPREADEILQACEMRHIRLAIAHQTHYAPNLTIVQDLIAQGEIGEILELRGRGKEDARGGGEDLWVLGSHIMDLMRFFGGDPLDCYATLSVDGRPVTKADVKPGNEGVGPLAGDQVTARYTFPKGVSGFFASRRKAGGSPSRFGLQIYGSKGVIEILTGYPAQVFLLRDAGWSPGRSNAKWLPVTSNGVDKPETLPKSGLDVGNVAAVHDLLRSIDDRREPLCGPSEGRWTVEMISAVFESHRVGKAVTFPLEQRENALGLLE